MRKLAIAATLAAGITSQAHADYAWQFDPAHVIAEDSSDSGMSFQSIGIPSSIAKTWLPQFVLTITDQAFANHSLSLGWSGCDNGCATPIHGDISSIVSFTGAEVPSPYGSGAVDLAYTKRGKLTGGFDLEGELTDFYLNSTGIGQQWAGYYASDNSECGVGAAQRCELTGRWAFLGDPPRSVPEPASITLLLAGMAGLAFAQQKRRQARA